MQQGGWLGHDYQHGRGSFCWWVGGATAGIINGFSPTWWSNKHNTHHVYPNFHGVDTDIAMDPVFHLWLPTQNRDVFIRKYQHLYFLPVTSVIYASWRMQSFQHAWNTNERLQLFYMFISYTWLLYLIPWWVSLGAIFFGGLLVGIVVTATHQSEPLTTLQENASYDYVKHQFDSTRDVCTAGNPFMAYLWGGMQYQLEHHLFPVMPRYYYGALMPHVQQFAREWGLDYRRDGVWQILLRTLRTMKYYAVTPPVPVDSPISASRMPTTCTPPSMPSMSSAATR